MPRTVRVYDEYVFGFSWVLEELMQRTSHALVLDGKVWLVDPVAFDEALDRAAGLGEIAGVLQLLDRHDRDCAELAERYGVPHLKVPDAIPGTPLKAIPVVRFPGWKETALWWPEQEALIVAEVVGTNEIYTGGRAAVGMHPMLRALPPRGLRTYSPRRLRCARPTSAPGATSRACWRSCPPWAADVGRLTSAAAGSGADASAGAPARIADLAPGGRLKEILHPCPSVGCSTGRTTMPCPGGKRRSCSPPRTARGWLQFDRWLPALRDVIAGEDPAPAFGRGAAA